MISPILAVKDVDTSVNFFVEILGFQHNYTLEGPDGKNAFAFVNLGNGNAIGLSLNPTNAGVGAGVEFMINLPEEMMIDDYYQSVKSKAATIYQEIRDQYWGDRTFSLRDPDGYALTFAQTIKQVSTDEIRKGMKQL